MICITLSHRQIKNHFQVRILFKMEFLVRYFHPWPFGIIICLQINHQSYFP